MAIKKLFNLFLLLSVVTATSAGAPPIINTNDDLNQAVAAHPETALRAVGNGFELRDIDGNSFGVIGEALLPEIHAREKRAEEVWAKRELYGEAGLEKRKFKLGKSKGKGRGRKNRLTNDCSHPRCFTHATCALYSDCHRPNVPRVQISFLSMASSPLSLPPESAAADNAAGAQHPRADEPSQPVVRITAESMAKYRQEQAKLAAELMAQPGAYVSPFSDESVQGYSTDETPR
ncbi:hypothetical protein AJ79_02600 [Helicocarpus griseus UAMH5409]|uniref:Uncharacterized protein n=1 Tax=Helicocarpus griseus UAMH5409 TaxID=1447875 RepID=A0A2B7Y214_9EURO|nr:hypothetical protein AJ79_02600 [Helicocarpus griseus UAMH5409]